MRGTMADSLVTFALTLVGAAIFGLAGYGLLKALLALMLIYYGEY
ncbi:hypothetical protein AWB77_00505 [Caballeronia fortuita]|uniref:Uncharacterized protein n=1 Tax=Caballeronia fortuita TaxID=1777138 RepID=A0A157ZBF5_9BURK|nr:hypothetical protein AWB77_00505 [Caballeronia fortuita]